MAGQDTSWRVLARLPGERTPRRAGGVATVAAAGFEVERIIEPKEDALAKAEGDVLDDRWMSLVPYTLIIKARKR